MIISIASGKGGTGKTTVAVNLALSLPKGTAQVIDCDVEEPNSHLFLNPAIHQVTSVGIPVPRIDESKCTYCGKCAQVCEYHAIAVILKSVLVFDELCHGCGACSYLCPEKAIFEVKREIGVVQEGNANGIPFVNGVLNIGEPMASPLIRKVKERIQSDKIVILDAPPGTACPVIETVKGSDFCLLVTEPTPFGLNDLELAVGMLDKLKIPMGVVINKADIGDREIWNYCQSRNIPIMIEIPMDEELPNPIQREFLSLLKTVLIFFDSKNYLKRWRYFMSQIEEGQELNDEVGYLVYNETLIDHFMHPRNVGEIENPDAMAVVGDPTCGDFIRVYLKVEDGKISAFKFLTQGCPGAISTSSIATELAIGKTLDEALNLTDNDVIEAAGGIPARKAHCSLLAIRGLHEAIQNYQKK